MVQVEGGGVAAGTQLNGIYEVDRRIAAGGMGEVYTGHQIATGDPVAIKMILPEHAANEIIIDLFRREAKTLHNLQHEAIVRYYLFSVDPTLGRPYMVMEFAAGPSLADRLRRGPLKDDDLATLRRRVASGLHAAHKLGVIHRDMSPDNVILVDGSVEKAKIIDFGIAKSNQAEGTLIGSGFAGKLNYVSPEQLGLAGADVAAASDIYSLGLVLAEAALGRPLDMGGTQAEVLEKRRAVPGLDGIPNNLRPLLEQMLQPDPKDRPADMEAVANWVPEGGRSRRKAVSSGPRQNGGTPWLAIGGGVGVVAAAGAAAFLFLAPPSEDTGVVTNPSTTEAGSPPTETATAPPATDEAGTGLLTPQTDATGTAPTAPVAPSRPPAEQNTAPQLTQKNAGPFTLNLGDNLNQIVATYTDDGGTGGLTASVVEGTIAPGLALTMASAGRIQLFGRTAAAGEFTFQVAARDSDGQTGTPVPIKVIVSTPTTPETTGPGLITGDPTIDYITNYAGGACFFARPVEIGDRTARIEVFGKDIQPVVAFDGDFKRDIGFEAKIEMRQITDAQCALVSILRDLGPRAIDNRIRVALTEDVLSSGSALRGAVSGGADARLFLMDSAGGVTDLTGQLQQAGTEARFGFQIQGSGPQVLIAAVPTVQTTARSLEEVLNAAQRGEAALGLGFFTMR